MRQLSASLAGKILLLSCLLACVSAVASQSQFLAPEDRNRLRKVFDAAWAQKDIPNIHYSILGYNLLGLGADVLDSPNTCKFIQSSLESANDVESIFHAVTAGAGLKSCSLTLSTAQKQLLSNALASEESSVQTLFQAVEASVAAKNPVDEAKVAKTLTSALKNDDSLLNLGLAFHIAANLQKVDVKPFFERIEDAVVQADEVDGKYLQFEGGLSITGMIVGGAYKLASRLKTAPAISADQSVKFANYFLSRKSVQTAKGAYYLLDVLKTLTNNQFHVPVAVTLTSPLSVSEASPWVRVKVTNLLGESLGPVKVSVDTAKRVDDNLVLGALSKTMLSPVQGDPTLYELNFMKASPSRGFYQLQLSAIPEKAGEASNLVGNVRATVAVKVMAEVALDSVEFWTADADGAAASKVLKVSHPNKLTESLEADDHQKVMAKFVVKDKRTGAHVTVHQAFFRFFRPETDQEIIFVAEPDPATKTYKFDLDVGAKGKIFGRQSGSFAVELIIGDATVSNPIQWTFGKVVLEFRSTGVSSDSGPVSAKKSKFAEYRPRPEIKHMFREPEKRPSDLVANTFSALVLVPLLLLIALWMKLGVNLSNFPVSLGAIGFHVGLGSIFGLYYVFWVKLDMFTTLKYLMGIGVVTFLCGNSVLAKVAKDRKKAGSPVEVSPSKTTKAGH